MDLIYQNLIDSTARIKIPNEQGTGFFVSSGLLLTCFHVVKETVKDNIEVFWEGNPYTPKEVKCYPELDLALLRVDITDHLYVALDADFNPFDDCFAYGYPPDNIGSNSASCKLEVINEDGASMGLVSKVIRPGFSGAPLLNIKTQKVCGLISKDLKVRLRGNILEGYGGTGIPVEKILEVYPELQNIETHPLWLIETAQGTKQEFIEALHEFNYRDEVGIFAEFLGADAPVGAFVICGEEEAGQKWLLNRLWRDEIRASTSGVKHKLKVKKKWTINTIWEKVGEVLGVAPAPDLIAQKMYNYWQNAEPVALILDRVEQLERLVIEELIEELWRPLAKCTSNCSAEAPLLLFLVDTSGEQEFDYICSMSRYNSDSPDVPVSIKLKEKFKDTDINGWTNKHKEIIKPLFKQYCLSQNSDFKEQLIDDFKDQIKKYNSQEDTTSEEVLGKICELCNHDWEENFTSKFIIK